MLIFTVSQSEELLCFIEYLWEDQPGSTLKQ